MNTSIQRFPTKKNLPFSEAVKAGGFVFLSGQVAMTDDGIPLKGSVAEQTQRIMHNITALLTHAGSSLDDTIKVKVWLSDMKYFSEFNTAYQPFFSEHLPARSLTTTTIAFDLDVEIEVQAWDRTFRVPK